VAEHPGFLVGAALAIRASAFAEIGGFDEDFFLNWEEADLCFRLGDAGWKIAHCPEATVTHLQGSSITRELNFTSYYAGLRLYHMKRIGLGRWPFFEAALVAAFAAGVVYAAAAATARPSTARMRLALVRQRWRERIFFRSARGGVTGSSNAAG
jgi:GT2 family glycosyltransferase